MKKYNFFRVLIPCLILVFFLFQNNLSLTAQCPTAADATCTMTSGQYDNVVIGEVSGDAGQSDGANDGIVEIVGPPGTNIGCMVVSNSEWAVLIPPGTTIPLDGAYLIACGQGNSNSGVGINGSMNGLVADGTEGDFNIGLLGEINLDVCHPVNANYYFPSKSGFTLDNLTNSDGDQVMIWRPNGDVQDGIYWGTASTTTGGSTTVGGASGNSDHVTIQVAGQTYTLGDNDGDGIVNNNLASVVGGRGDGTNARAVAVLPTDAACPCNTSASPGTFTMPSLSDTDFWFEMQPNFQGCNSSFGRVGPNAGSNGNPSHMDGLVTSTGTNTNGSPSDNGGGATGGTTGDPWTPSSYTPSSCVAAPTVALANEWGYTDHPTPGQPNNDPAFVFYASTDQVCTVGDMVTFTVEVYNYQNVSDNTDIMSGVDNIQTGSYVFDPISGTQVPWTTYAVAGETTTMTYTATMTAAGNFSFGLVWDDFSNCCGTPGTPHSQSNPNECYEVETIVVEVVEPMVYDCDGDGVADDTQTACAISCDPGPPAPGTININDFITGGSGLTFTLSDDSGTNADLVNTTGVFTLEDDAAAGPYTVTINDGSGCTATDLVITIADDCEKPPICPTALDNDGTTEDGTLCPGDMIELCLDGTDLPEGGTICWYEVESSDATPVDGTDPLFGCVTIPVTSSVTPSNLVPVINEVLFNPISNDGTAGANGEFIEIAAAPGTNIGGWLLYDPDWSILIPAGTTIPASGFLVVGFAGDAELPAGKSVDLNVGSLAADDIGGSPLTLANGNELVGLSMPDGLGGFTFVTGVDYGGTDSDNITPLGANAGGGSYNFSGSSFTSGPSGEVNGESIGLITDGNLASGYDESGDIPNSTGENTGGCPNSESVDPIPCLTVSLDASYCSGDIFINSLISGVPSSCPAGSDVGIGADYSMACPDASITASAFDVCEADMASIDIPVNLSGLSSGNYRVGYQIGSGPVQFVSAAGTATTVNINIPGPTDGEVKVTLVSVYNDIDGDMTEDTADGECSGTINDAEVCVNIRPTEDLTLTAAVDPLTCSPCDGTVTFDIAGGTASSNTFEIDYTFNGTTLSLSGVSMPYTLTGACPGTYDITAATDDAGCAMTVTSNVMTLDPPSGMPVTVSAQPAAICGTNMTSVDLTMAATYSPPYDAADFDFFSVDPNTLPPSVINNTPPMLASTTVSPTATTTYWVRYTDPISSCESFTTVIVTIDNSLCFTCPTLSTLSDPADPCVGGTFDLSVSGLDADQMNQTTGGGAFGIEFFAFSGATIPPDAYTGGTSLGTVLNAALTMTDTEAEVTGVGGSLTAGDYQICAVLTGTPTDPTCRPQVCVAITVNALPTLNAATLTVCEDAAGSGQGDFTLTDAENTANGDVDGDAADGSTSTVTYHTSQSGAQANTGAYANGDDLTPGTDEVWARVVDANGCVNTIQVTIVVNSLPTLNAATLTVCEDAAGSGQGDFTLTDAENTANGDVDGDAADGSTSTVTYHMSQSGAQANTGAYANGDDLTPGTDEVWARVVDANGCVNTIQVTIAVNSLPTVSVTSSSVCMGAANFTVTGSPVPGAGETGTWSAGTGILSDIDPAAGTATFNASSLAAGNYPVTYTFVDANGCTADDSGTITIFANPTLVDAAVCAGATVSMIGSGTAAATTPYSSSNTGVATVDDSGTVTGVGAGISAITYTDNNGCQATAIVTVNANPILSIDDPDICYDGSTLFDLSTLEPMDMTGGVWSDAADNTVDPTTVVPVNGEAYTYTFMDANGCTATATITLNVDSAPPATIEDMVVCMGATSVDITLSPGNADNARITHFSLDFDAAAEAAGFSDMPSATMTSGATITLPSPLAAGTYNGTITLIYEINNVMFACEVTDDFTITVSAEMNAGTDGTISVCNEDVTEYDFNLFDQLGGTGITTGGTWSETTMGTSSGVTPTGGSNGAVSMQGIDPGTYEFTYALTGTPPCMSMTSTVTVTVTSCYDLALNKTLFDNSPYRPGDNAVFAITVFNQGSVDAFNVTVEDYFPSCLTYVSSAFGGYIGSNQPTVTDNATNGFELDRLVAGESVQINVTFTIAATCAETSLVNNAEITGGSSTNGGQPANDADSTPGDDADSDPDPEDNNISNMTGGDDFDPAMLTICQTGCTGTFPWSGQN